MKNKKFNPRLFKIWKYRLITKKLNQIIRDLDENKISTSEFINLLNETI